MRRSVSPIRSAAIGRPDRRLHPSSRARYPQGGTMAQAMISADSHITEHPDTYRKYIDPKLRDRAPHLAHDAAGDVFVIPDLTQGALPMGLIAAAGKRPEEIRMTGRFEEWHRGGWDPEARLADQARDGLSAGVLCPTVGLVPCPHLAV